MRLARFLLVILGIVGFVPRAFAQPSDPTASTHLEVIQPASPREASAIGEISDWILRDGKVLKGTLLRWYDHPGLVRIREQTSRVALLPIRSFSNETQNKINEALAEHAKLIQNLQEMGVQNALVGKLNFVDGEKPDKSLPIALLGDHVYWVRYERGQAVYARCTRDKLDEDSRKLLEETIEKRLPSWETIFPGINFGGTLIGKSPLKYVFKDYEYRNRIRPAISYTVFASDLNQASREKADKLIADKGLPNFGSDETPNQVLIPIPTSIQDPIEVISSDESNFKLARQQFVQGPKRQFQQTKRSQNFRTIFRYRTELLLRELIAANPSESLDIIEKQFDERLASIVAEAPIQSLSPNQFWSLRDSRPRNLFGILVGEKNSKWFFIKPPAHGETEFKVDESTSCFAVLKSELLEADRAAGESYLEVLAEYKRLHANFVLPKLDSKALPVRSYSAERLSQPAIVEPVELIHEPPYRSAINARVWGAPGSRTRPFNLSSLHPIDLDETKLLLSGDAGTETDREARLANIRFQELQTEQNWAIQQTLARRFPSRQSNNAFPNQVFAGFRAQYLGTHNGSFVFKNEKGSFLLDPTLLSEASRTQANSTESELKKLSREMGIDRVVEAPVDRCWGSVLKLVIGHDLSFSQKGNLNFVRPSGERDKIEASKMTPEFRASVEAQMAADERFGLNTLAASETAELKKFLLAESTRRLKLAAEMAPQDWKQLDSAIVLKGSFEMFDGRDAILRDGKGSFFRVYKFSLKDESLKEMERQAAQRLKEGRKSLTENLDPKAVKIRMYRGRGMMASYVPGEPVLVDSEFVYFESENGGSFKHPLDRIHPRDVTEMRSDWYLAVNPSFKRDSQIDERLRSAVAPDEVIRGQTELHEEWKAKLDAVAKPIPRIWTTSPLELKKGEIVRAISFEGNLAAIQDAENQVRVLDVRTGESNTTTIADQTATFIVCEESKSIVAASKDGYVCCNITDGKTTKIAAPSQANIIGAKQSKDGLHVFVLHEDGTLADVNPQTGELLHQKLGGARNLESGPWCSEDGQRIAVASSSKLYLYSWLDSSKKFDSDEPLTVPYSNPFVSFGNQLLLVSDRSGVSASIVIEQFGRRGVVQLVTGLVPKWIGIESIRGKAQIHVVGQRQDPLSSKASYEFSAIYGFDSKLDYKPQTTPFRLQSDALFSQSGHSLIHKRDGKTVLLRRAKLHKAQFKQLDPIAADLVSKNEVDQIDAAWRYLRTSPFQRLGDYPDDAAELFLDYVSLHIQNFKWQHGGDLAARGELLLKRWTQLAPESMMVPTLNAMYGRDKAWEARGTGFANRVTAAQFQEFEKGMQSASTFLKPMFNEKLPPTRAFNIAFDVGMSLSFPIEKTKQLANQMFGTPIRYSTPAHSAVALSLLPRWHGEPGDSERYVTNVANRVGGPHGDLMYAQLILYLCKYYPSNEPPSGYLEYDIERVADGLNEFYKRPRSETVMQLAMSVFAREGKLDLYKQAMQLCVDRKIFVGETSVDAYLNKTKIWEAIWKN